MNPFRRTDAEILQDTDLAGPLVFCLAFGGFLLLTGKLHFGYIYGIGLMGCVAMYFLLNLMSMQGVSMRVMVSVLGYCLLRCRWWCSPASLSSSRCRERWGWRWPA